MQLNFMKKLSEKNSNRIRAVITIPSGTSYQNKLG